MTIRNYITLNGKKYMTSSRQWDPVIVKPSTVRYTVDPAGVTDITYGPASAQEWRGVLMVPVSPATGWGSISDLVSVLATLGAVSFTDHYGASYSVHIIGEFPERSLTPAWDGASNEFRIPVRLVATTGLIG
jgi:hypothetical protein